MRKKNETLERILTAETVDGFFVFLEKINLKKDDFYLKIG